MATARRATKLTMMATTTTMAMGGNRWQRRDGQNVNGDDTMATADDDDSGDGRRRRWRRRDGRHVNGDGTTGNKDDDDGSS